MTKYLLIPALIFGSIFTSKAQAQIHVGANKKILDIVVHDASTQIAYQDTVLANKGESSYYIAIDSKISGPFEFYEKKAFKKFNYITGDAQQIDYFILGSAKNKTIYWNSQSISDQFVNPRLMDISGNYCAVVDNAKKGDYYEIFENRGSFESIEKSKSFGKQKIETLRISEAGDVYIHYFIPDKYPSHSFKFQNTEHSGFYYVHFEGWIRKNDQLIPLCNGIFPDDELESMNHVYLGNELMAKLSAILYDLQLNSESTNFVLKGFEKDKVGAKVYTNTLIHGPYLAVSNLEMHEDDSYSFDYKDEQGWFSFLSSASTSSPIADPNSDYYWKSMAPNNKDFVKCVETEDDSLYYYFNDSLILTSFYMEDTRVDFWTEDNQPVIVHSRLKSADPDPTDDEVWNGWVPDGYQLFLNGSWTETYPLVYDVSESPKGELAYIVSDQSGAYVIRENDNYGPFQAMYTYGNEHDCFMKWSEDGNDLIYYVINERRSRIMINDEQDQSFAGVLRVYWNDNLESSAISLVHNLECLIESDYYADALHDDPYIEDMEHYIVEEVEKKRAKLNEIGSCMELNFKGGYFPDFAFISDFKYHNNGNTISFKNLEDSYVIYDGKLFSGTIINDTIFIMDGDSIELISLQN